MKFRYGEIISILIFLIIIAIILYLAFSAPVYGIILAFLLPHLCLLAAYW